MPSDITTAIIAAASAIGGGAIVAGSNYAISRAQARDAHRAELRRTLISLLHALGLLDHRLRTEPQPGPIVKAINEQMARRVSVVNFNLERIYRRLLDPQADLLVDRFSEAMAATILIAPPDLLPPLKEVADLMANVKAGDEEWRTKWEAARVRLSVESRRALGEQVGAAPVAS